MRRFTVLATAVLVALGVLAGPVSAHPHKVVTPKGGCAEIPTEPEHIHDADPTNGAISNNKHHNSEPDGAWGHALHPIHHFLHMGPGQGNVEVQRGTC